MIRSLFTFIRRSFKQSKILPIILALTVSAEGAGKKDASPGANLGQLLKERVVTDAVGALLNNQLPLKLDASNAFPTVTTLPGGPFDPQRLVVTGEAMDTPLPPGDYTIRALAFCSEYSVHRAGAGIAYQIGPIQGRAADAIAALYWRGTVEKRIRPRSLLVVGWAIQGGVTYAKMTKPYQAIVDEVIPDYRDQLGSDFVQNLEDLYATHAKSAGLPPLNTLLTKLGKPGELVLSANRQRRALLRRNTNDQIKDQVLFAGQEQRVAAVKPEEGPWTERIPGVAYVRYRVVGGNVRANNEIQIRILPRHAPRSVATNEAKVVFASYTPSTVQRIAAAKPKTPQAKEPSVRELTSDGIGYSTSRAAQVLYFAPAPDPEPKDADAVARADQLQGAVNLTRDGATRPLRRGEDIKMGDTLTTADGGRLRATFADGTELTLAANSALRVDDYVYSPRTPDDNHASFSWLEGSFKYTSGLIAKHPNPDITINTPYGALGPRGTEFIGQLDLVASTANIKLINGILECNPRQVSTSTRASAPVMIDFNSSQARTSPLAKSEYEAAKPPVFIR